MLSNTKIVLSKETNAILTFQVEYYNYVKYRQEVEYFKADSKLMPAKNVYLNTPGQGFYAKQITEDFEKNIGYIKFILNDIERIAQKAIVLNYNVLILDANTLDVLDDMLNNIAPIIYKKFVTQALMPVISELNNEQVDANRSAKRKAEKRKERLTDILYNIYQGSNDDAAKSMKRHEVRDSIRIPQARIEKVNASAYYSTGNNIPSATPPDYTVVEYAPKYPEDTIKELYADFERIDLIITGLERILKIITECDGLIMGSVTNILGICNHNHCPAYDPSIKNITEYLHYFEDEINDIKGQYEQCRELILEYSKGGDFYEPYHDMIDEIFPTDPPTDAPAKEEKQEPIKPDPGPTPTNPPTNAPTNPPTVAPTNAPTTPPTERPTEQITQPTPTTPPTNAPTNPPTYAPTNPQPQPSGYTPTGGGGSDDEVVPTETPTAVVVDEDVIVPGRTYKLPTSSKPVAESTTTTTSKGGSSVIPVLAGLAAAAAAGVGAKAYIDRKNNRDNEENEEFKAEDWSGNTEISMEYEEPEDRNAETLDFDEPGYQEEEPERYGAKTSQDLEKLQ